MGPNQHYQNIWELDAANSSHTTFNAESVDNVVARTAAVVEELESSLRGVDVLLVSHGDTLQILQAYVSGTDPRVHRQLPHLNTGEIRQIAWVGMNRPATPAISVLPPTHSTANYWPSLWSSGSTSRRSSPGSSPSVRRHDNGSSTSISPPRPPPPPPVTPLVEDTCEDTPSPRALPDDGWWPPVWVWVVASVFLAGLTLYVVRRQMCSTRVYVPRNTRITFAR